MKHLLWHYLDEAVGYLAGFLVLVAGMALIIFGVPIVAEVVFWLFGS